LKTGKKIGSFWAATSGQLCLNPALNSLTHWRRLCGARGSNDRTPQYFGHGVHSATSPQ